MRRSLRRRLRLLLAIIFLCVIMLFSFVELRIRPLVSEFSRSRARQLASELVDRAVLTLLSESEELVTLREGSDGVAGAEVNTRAIARLRTEAVQEISLALSDAETLRLEIPMMNLFGSTLTSGVGIPVTVRLLPVGDIVADVKSEFVESGINQVLHRVVLRVHVSLKLLIANQVSEIELLSDIPLAETVIVGVVPEAYTAINRYEIDDQEENDLNDYMASIP